MNGNVFLRIRDCEGRNVVVNLKAVSTIQPEPGEEEKVSMITTVGGQTLWVCMSCEALVEELCRLDVVMTPWLGAEKPDAE